MNCKQGVSKSFFLCMAYYMYIIVIVSFFIVAFMAYSPSFYFHGMIIFSFCVWHISKANIYIHVYMPYEKKDKVWTNTRICQFYSIWPAFPPQYWVPGHLLPMCSFQNTVYISSLKYTGIVNVIAISSLILQLQWPLVWCFFFFVFIDEWYM